MSAFSQRNKGVSNASVAAELRILADQVEAGMVEVVVLGYSLKEHHPDQLEFTRIGPTLFHVKGALAAMQEMTQP